MDITLKFLIPEIFLSACILAHLIFNIFIVKQIKINSPIVNKENLFQCFFILVCCFLLVFKTEIEGTVFGHFLLLNNGLNILKLLALSLTLFVLIPCWRQYVTDKLNFFEFFTLYLLSALAFLLLISANDLLIIYLLLELQSLIFYILVNKYSY